MAVNIDRIWRTALAGLCGSAAHSGLMLLKSRMGWLPSFQPYHDLQQTLSQLTGSAVNPLVPWALSFLNGAVLLGFLFGRVYRRLPGESGAAKGLVFGVLGWMAMGLVVFPMLGHGLFATAAGFGFQPAAFSLLMVLSYSVIMGVIYSALLRGWRADAKRPLITREYVAAYPSIWVSPQTEIACPEIVLPRGLHMNRIWSAICSGVT